MATKTEGPAPKVHSRKALLFILITITLDTIGIGIIIPVIPDLITEITGGTLPDAAVHGGILMTSYAVMQFLFAPIMGNLSDRFGRRPLLLASMVAFSADYILMGLAPTLAWLVAGRIIAGIVGATATTANAYVADVSTPETRAQNFGLIGAAWGIGFILGPALGGILGELGPRVPFFVCAGLTAINFVYGSLVLPETLGPENRRPFSWKRSTTFGAITQMRKYPVVLSLFAALVLYQIAHDANPAIWTYYTMHKFGWTKFDVGLSMAVVGVLIMIVMGWGTRVVVRAIGELRAIYLGLVFGAIGYAGFALSQTGWLMLAFLVPFSLFGIAMPALRSIMSNCMPDNAQGELQGAITSIISLTAVVSPMFMTTLFRSFSTEGAAIYFPGAPYMVAALLMLGSALTVGIVWRAFPQMQAAAANTRKPPQ